VQLGTLFLEGLWGKKRGRGEEAHRLGRDGTAREGCS